MKLNLGCGRKIMQGYTNVDIIAWEGVDMLHDLEKPLPIEDNCIEEVWAEDVLEHFSFMKTERIFSDWVRVLESGGNITIIVPNIDAHIRMYQTCEIDKKNNKPVDLERLRHLIFGGQDYATSFHYTTFTVKAVEDLFKRNNLEIVNIRLSQKGIIATGKKK